MSITLDELITDAKTLPLVPLAASSAYQEHTAIMTRYVDDIMTKAPDISQ